MAKAYPPHVREQVRQLHKQGLDSSQIHHVTGLSYQTIKRWVDPGYNERQLTYSRERKRSRRGKCAKCGQPIWYTSTLCVKCAHPGRKWTRERIIQAMQDWAAAHDGKQPSTVSWHYASEQNPAATSVFGPGAVFRTWNEAITAAGFTPKHSSPGPGNISWDVEEAQEMRRQGLSDVEIGRRMGVTAGAIQLKLGPRGIPRPPNLSKRTREQRIADLRKALEHQ